SLQPDAAIFSDAGPDVRWAGNEKGLAGEPNWATLTRDDFVPGRADVERLNHGDRPGSHWVPAECDGSIRPGWFYHERENDQVKTAENLVDLYYSSVGRGASFLLNLAPDRRGQIPPGDVKSLRNFRTILNKTFEKNLAEGATAIGTNVRGSGDEMF